MASNIVAAVAAPSAAARPDAVVSANTGSGTDRGGQMVRAGSLR
jgi:hypothetical protein